MKLSKNNIVRFCSNEECGWVGFTNRMLGSIGPVCDWCGDITEEGSSSTAEQLLLQVWDIMMNSKDSNELVRDLDEIGDDIYSCILSINATQEVKSLAINPYITYSEYKYLLLEVSNLIDLEPEEGSVLGKRLEVFANIIEKYEKRFD